MAKEDQGQESKRPRVSEDMEWANKPPYVLADPKNHPEAKYKGSCHCKDVTFDLFKDPIDAHFCHCDICQKLHGSAAHWSAIMEKPNVLFTCKPENLSFYRTEDQSNRRELPLKVTCKRCHAPVCDEGRNMMLMYPSLIDFKDISEREPFMPRRHIFYSFRCIDVADDMKKFEKMADGPEMSEQAEHGKPGIAGGGSRPHEKESNKNKKDE